MSTLFVNNLNTASGSTITIPTGKTLVSTDTPIVGTGNIIQVGFAQHNTQVSWTSQDSETFIFQASITPKFTTSKILYDGILGTKIS